ncbi:MAG: hypothetical protein L3J59_13805 [Methylococcaceae bacterium]|nr:hypothetical protein [Methylococcaceae bacterium]
MIWGKKIEKNKKIGSDPIDVTGIAQDFCLSSRRRNRRIAGVVTVAATRKRKKC